MCFSCKADGEPREARWRVIGCLAHFGSDMVIISYDEMAILHKASHLCLAILCKVPTWH